MPPAPPQAGPPGRSEFRIWRRPLQSLPTRISFFVLAATLTTSLVVTGISVQSMDGFLRAKVLEKFRDVSANVSDRVDLWYARRGFEIDRIAKDPILIDALPSLQAHTSSSDRQRAQHRAIQHLDTALRLYPDQRALFLVEPSGKIALWVGNRGASSASFVERMASKYAQGSSPIVWDQGRRLQIVSCPIETGDSDTRMTLHALLRLERLDEELVSQGLGETGHVYILGPDEEILASSRGEFERSRKPAIASHTDPAPANGEATARSSRKIHAFGWTLVAEEEYGAALSQVVATIRHVLGINLAIAALLGIVAYRIAVGMVRPIEDLSTAAQRVTRGEKGVAIPESDALDEVGILTRVFNEMTSRVEINAREIEEAHEQVAAANDQLRSQNDELSRMNEILAQLSITDGLTQLHNHRYFQDFLARETKRADRSHQPLSLVLVDLDHFKMWNDRLGHAGGDEILRRVGDVMKSLIRSEDLLARYGGEEFALVAPGTDLEGAVQLAEKMRITIARTRFFIDPPSEHEAVTVSMGVALYQGNRKKFFNDADQALYRAKASGRDCVMVADPESTR